MSRYPTTDGRDHGRVATEASSADGSRGGRWDISEVAGRPSLRVWTVERTAVVRFGDAENLFEDGAVHTVGRELRRLIEDEGHTRLVVNFAGVRYLSTEVLAILAGLQRKVDPLRGRIVLCRMDPLLRDMVRITHLDRIFEICGEEAEAFGIAGRPDGT